MFSNVPSLGDVSRLFVMMISYHIIKLNSLMATPVDDSYFCNSDFPPSIASFTFSVVDL